MPQTRTDLEHFFHPQGTAIIGRIEGGPNASAASFRERYARFGERFYLVNPKGGTVAGSIPTVCWRTPDSASPPVQEIQWAIWGYDPATHSATGILATGVFAAPGTLPKSSAMAVL